MVRADDILRPVRAGDAEELALTMRAEDAAEALACGLRPIEALRQSLAASSSAFAVELGGRLAGLFGVCPGPSGSLLEPTPYDIVWLLTGHAVDVRPGAFWRLSQRAVGALLEVHPVLANMVPARYARALRWARRLGAEVGPAVPWGVSGEFFHPVIWRAPWA